MMKKTIRIPGVDTGLLEEQRKTLNKALDGYRDGRTLQLYNYEVTALIGLLNMLDFWSDERHHDEDKTG